MDSAAVLNEKKQSNNLVLPYKLHGDDRRSDMQFSFPLTSNNNTETHQYEAGTPCRFHYDRRSNVSSYRKRNPQKATEECAV